ncbi:MAG: cytochrome C [Candidatus Hydrogenedentes bacterium]|nr:cytochrome C [Candidatus Hydrogenedentota bacterium]
MRSIFLLLLVLLAVSFFVLQAFAKINDSHHDFSSAGWSGGELCIVCHTPHSADTTVSDAPLWNHEVTKSTYTPYASRTLDALPGQPSGVTKLCFSCHDGTVAVDAFAGLTGSWFTSAGNLGTDLTRHHPISFVYDSALAASDSELHDPASAPSGLGGTIATDLLRNDRLECVSCHDVHISRNNSGCIGCHFVHGATTKTLSLWKSNERSALCFTCHNK